MQVQEKVFPTKIFGDIVRVSHDVPDLYIKALVESRWQFVWGKQTIVETSIDRTDYKVVPVPEKSLLNIFCFFIITFCPDLNFGWLVPTMMLVKTPQKVITSNTIVNVIPLADYNSTGHVKFLMYGAPDKVQSRGYSLKS